VKAVGGGSLEAQEASLAVVIVLAPAVGTFSARF
jgi:hypothetical protein